MNIEAELVDHPKYLLLREMVGPNALEYLIRIWGHCAANRRGEHWKGKDGKYLEIVARWTGDRSVLFMALVEVGFVENRLTGIVIHDWESNNSITVANWTRNLNGRPSKKKPSKTPQEANTHTAGSHGEAAGNPRGSRGDPVCMNECMNERVLAPSLSQDSEPLIPTEAEVRAWALGSPAAVHPDYAAEKWADTSEKHLWIVKGELIDWKARWTRWWATDRPGWIQRRSGILAKNGAASGLEDRIADLRQQLEKAVKNGDPVADDLRQQIAALKAQRAKDDKE
jgi:hypothetical protein